MGNGGGFLRWMIVLLCLALAGPAAAAQRARETDQKEKKKKKAEEKDEKERKPQVSGRARAKELRAEWNLGDLKMTREAVDEASFKPSIKQTAVEALETFIAQQEELLRDVEQSPEAEAKAVRKRAKFEQAYTQQMAVIYQNEELRRELAKSLKAVEREMDEMAMGAERLFGRIEQVGLTPEQKQRIRPAVQEASAKVKGAVDKSATRSTKDRMSRDEVVATFKESRKKIKQHLTPEQRAKLKEKMSEA